MATGKRYEDFVKKGRPWWRILLEILLSNVGLGLLCILYASMGAYLFVRLELPAEEIRKQTKMAKNQDVEEAIEYLKDTFWQYANSERFNYTEEQFIEEVGKDITNLKMFVLTYNKDFGFDTTENWTYDWTFPKSLLLVVTIMTTIGGFFVSKFEGFL